MALGQHINNKYMFLLYTMAELITAALEDQLVETLSFEWENNLVC